MKVYEPRRWVMMLASFMVWTGSARGYLVGLPLSLEKLAAEADVIFKGTVISSEPVRDDWFKPCTGYVARETKFTVISVIKGAPAGEALRFRHYDQAPQQQFGSYSPQHYHFEPSRTYLVFARKTADAAIYRQLWENHTGKDDQGAWLCSDKSPVRKTSVADVIWEEQALMLKGADPGNVTYAIRQLDEMSGGRGKFDATEDFERIRVLNEVHGLMTHPTPEIAQAAIALIGSHNPYLTDERTDYWLATVGSAEIPGLGKMDPKMRNIGGEMYWKDLVAIASSNQPAATRALAIRALGLVREPLLREASNRWLADSDASVRAAATVLLADFPGPETNRLLTVLAGDPAPVVRESAARAIGFSQQKERIDVLCKLLADSDSKVRRVASVSLLSFSPKDEAVARVFRENLGNMEFAPLFLNALARENPEPYLDELTRVLDEKSEPKNWSGGQIPAFTSWNILFDYLLGQSPETLKSGKLNRYLDALEKVGRYSSSEPRDIYAFYVLNGMPERAKKFRAMANKESSYDLDYFFKQVDEGPSNYKRSPGGW